MLSYVVSTPACRKIGIMLESLGHSVEIGDMAISISTSHEKTYSFKGLYQLNNLIKNLPKLQYF
jgi:hypothetical protein